MPLEQPMLATLRRRASVYGAFAAIMPKMFLAYSIWVWMQFIVSVITIGIFVAFWTAVYANQDTLSGLDLQQTLNYIILAQLFSPAVHAPSTIYYFGELITQGQIGIELLRPLDFQGATYVTNVAQVAVGLVIQIPLAIVAWLLFRYQFPLDPLIWLAFLVTLILGNALMFCFDWILSCAAFYSTEVWGLSVLRFAIATFFSGALVPLVMMPGWLQTIAEVLPFSQALYVPVSLISGITPLSAMPRIWLIQIGYLVVLLIASRLVFRFAVKKVTVQGG